jgi:aldehyde dehydrogenase (NAD+)
MQPISVVGLITPWNSNAGFICSKLSMAVAAGRTAVIKPSEMSALQSEAAVEALHAAEMPPECNVVNGRGDAVGAELTTHPDVAKISFSDSTTVGKQIVRTGADTMKRVTLELGGKSPCIILGDADLDKTVPGIIEDRIHQQWPRVYRRHPHLKFSRRKAARPSRGVGKVSNPRDPNIVIGPLVSQKQWERA